VFVSYLAPSNPTFIYCTPIGNQFVDLCSDSSLNSLSKNNNTADSNLFMKNFLAFSVSIGYCLLQFYLVLFITKEIKITVFGKNNKSNRRPRKNDSKENNIGVEKLKKKC